MVSVLIPIPLWGDGLKKTKDFSWRGVSPVLRSHYIVVNTVLVSHLDNSGRVWVILLNRSYLRLIRRVPDLPFPLLGRDKHSLLPSVGMMNHYQVTQLSRCSSVVVWWVLFRRFWVMLLSRWLGSRFRLCPSFLHSPVIVTNTSQYYHYINVWYLVYKLCFHMENKRSLSITSML